MGLKEFSDMLERQFEETRSKEGEMKKIVYKVVGRHEGKLVSVWVGARYRTPFSLTYAEGEITKAPRGTAIFTFDSLESARTWATDYFNKGEYEIWKCKGYKCKRQTHYSLDSSYLTHWGGVETFAALIALLKEAEQYPSTGTVFCSSVTLLSKVGGVAQTDRGC